MNSGFYLVNKPSGITSSNLVLKIKHLKKLQKIGHTGTLDRFASGLLILPFGQYTSFASCFLKAHKTYLVEVAFGKFTDSGDPDGNILEEWEQQKINSWLEKNSQTIVSKVRDIVNWKTQIPPVISALKIKRKRMSDLYRAQKNIQPKPRPIEILESKFLNMSQTGFEFLCTVSAGTYIRKIVIDLSTELNFPMYVSRLIRTQIGKVSLEQSNNLEDFELNKEKIYLPNEILNFPLIEIEENWKSKVLNGVKIPLPKLYKNFLIQDKNKNLLAWCESIDGVNYKYKKVFSF